MKTGHCALTVSLGAAFDDAEARASATPWPTRDSEFSARRVPAGAGESRWSRRVSRTMLAVPRAADGLSSPRPRLPMVTRWRGVRRVDVNLR